MAPRLPLLLRAREAAAELGVTDQTIYDWYEQGKLKGVKLGARSVRFRRDVIERIARDGMRK